MPLLIADDGAPTTIEPLVDGGAGPGAWLRERLFLPSVKEVDPRHRGFHLWESGPSIVEPVGRSFLSGYRAGLRAASVRGAVAAIQVLPVQWRGFAMEGLGMAAGVRDAFGPSGRRFADLLVLSGERHAYMLYVGLGWSLARVPGAAWPKLERFDPLVAPLILDGFAFHQTFFRTEKVLEQRTVPFPLERRWPGSVEDGEQQLAQGVGRALWFVAGGSPAVAAELIDRFDQQVRSSLWAGMGLAAAYAGGRDAAALRQLQDLAGEDRVWLAQGASFAVDARLRAGTEVPHTEVAAQVLCGGGADEVSVVTRESRPDPVRTDTGDWSGYEHWRRAIAARLA
ncbi:DUF1702 family protein [Aeromicrobium sp. CF3.5]|uniref:DUF1702 family protein n=1 Tax=Aeromicrobium sp. CF3.5 TaxID=3373078 RepID=UPI003EE5BB05